ncbi:MAG: hypothetical protein A3G49_02410 [Candidatus Sungbacteria bacterium RIFCSPLOWO2_12_FULL_41_11]|uniref:AMP-dependent synthetase/ligase domain-containing protein n=1 Tax=Candidatus Sungbacteria bacterium RIFCSPLOWO2_12_FULL_41_11 TaxID=1802286 RepID=A0A1G2LNU1_9BACT|nr:MAG: hypothetical protein UV01_C0004G0072 [Parcubacteria group bacterium GW2011_GWA2_42_14]OGZ99045.1 MAG: hypothetical protein A3D41_03325 [Candidatus Sungbacteria bacterium RIFCSPHIGHO2_02_FULL_41_12b]OHA13194.1 MAG: hypothetical protein A3G49_02410 [Candidatus Sungbacteria bacterium RIFCSPLOWO2_12_FULL_41_11]
MKPTKLVELINYVWQNSNFYRELWKRNEFFPEKDFQNDNDLKKIPILTKEDLLSISVQDRTIFTSNNYYYFADISSGTGGRPLITIKSHHFIPPYYNFIQKLTNKSPKSCLMLRPASNAAASIGAGLQGQFFPPGSIISLGDINDFILSANIAREMEVDWLGIRPSTAVSFAKTLEQQGYSPSHIMFLYLTGEPLTSAAISLLKHVYPRALILYIYAMTEGPSSMGMRSSLCATLEAISPNAYHLNTQDFIFETVNGLSIVTALHQLPAPLIRYNTGDRMIIKNGFKCSCGFSDGTIGVIGPRDSEKSYKIGNFVFREEAIKRALGKLTGFFTEDFELQIEQITENNLLLLFLCLTIRPINEPTPFITSTIKEILEREVRISPTESLGDAIRRKRIKPIEIKYDVSLKGSRILPPAEIIKPFQNI